MSQAAATLNPCRLVRGNDEPRAQTWSSTAARDPGIVSPRAYSFLAGRRSLREVLWPFPDQHLWSLRHSGRLL